MLIFPDTENLSGNCKTIATSFQHRDNFDVLNIKGSNWVVVKPFGIFSLNFPIFLTFINFFFLSIFKQFII